MAADVTRDELAAALASRRFVVEEPRLKTSPAGDVFLAAVSYPGAVAEELLAHIEDRRKARRLSETGHSCASPYCNHPDCGADDEAYATLQAEHLAAADLDPNWPATYE